MEGRAAAAVRTARPSVLAPGSALGLLLSRALSSAQAISGCSVPATIKIFFCATGERIRQLEPEMSKEDVIANLGKPEGYKKQGKYEQ